MALQNLLHLKTTPRKSSIMREPFRSPNALPTHSYPTHINLGGRVALRGFRRAYRDPTFNFSPQLTLQLPRLYEREPLTFLLPRRVDHNPACDIHPRFCHPTLRPDRPAA